MEMNWKMISSLSLTYKRSWTSRMKTMKKISTTLTLKLTLRIWSCKPKNLKRSSKLRATGRSLKRFCFTLRIKKMWQL